MGTNFFSVFPYLVLNTENPYLVLNTDIIHKQCPFLTLFSIQHGKAVFNIEHGKPVFFANNTEGPFQPYLVRRWVKNTAVIALKTEENEKIF